jgi:hypothetical protein
VSQKAAISFWGQAQNPVALLDQFFSLIHQTNGNWLYLIEISPHHSASMHRLMWELQQRDARVCVLSKEAIKTHLSSTAGVRLPPDAVLAFDAVEEFVTLLQEHPEVEYITADLEKWSDIDQQVLRCWGLTPSEQQGTYKAFDFYEGILVNSQSTTTSMTEEKLLKNYAHIPKVLYRLMPFAEA